MRVIGLNRQIDEVQTLMYKTWPSCRGSKDPKMSASRCPTIIEQQFSQSRSQVRSRKGVYKRSKRNSALIAALRRVRKPTET